MSRQFTTIIGTFFSLPQLEREIKVLLERNISVIWQHMFQMSGLPVQLIFEGVKQNWRISWAKK